MKKWITDLVHFNRHVRRPLKRVGLLMAMVMLISIGAVSALSADVELTRKASGLQSYPVAADTTIYKGALVVVSATGYLEELTDAASKRFVGIAYEKVVNTSAAGYGDDGELNCRVYTEGVFKLAATSITQAMVGQMMYGVDDQTVDDTTGGTYYIPVGRLVEYVDTDEGWVDIGQRHVQGGADDILFAPNATKILEVHTWGSVLNTGHLYLRSDFTGYIGMSAANVLMIGTSAGKVEFRCGAHGAAINIDNDGLSTAYRIRTTGTLDFGPNHTGTLKLPRKTEPITQPEEGTVWYNTTDDKLEFATASGMEQVTSA